MVAAAAALDAARGVSAAGGGGGSSGGAAQVGGGSPPSASAGDAGADAAAAAAFQRSLLLDAAAAAGVAAAHASAPPPALPALVAALTRALSSPRPIPAATPPSPPCAAVCYTTGIGKSGAVAARLAISLRSLGVRASFVHGSEWAHGDLGAAGRDDVVIAFSHSGRTAELLGAGVALAGRGVRVFSVTGDETSPMARGSAGHLWAPVPAAPASSAGGSGAGSSTELLGSVPTRSIVAQEAVANGVLAALVAAVGLTPGEFKAHHPGGAIGAAGVAAAA